MIRRDVISAAGPAWVLISQVEHARLSAELAAAWGRGAIGPLDPYDDVLYAVRHHDDGWARWEECPEVDRVTGRPLSFLEMALGESLAIWSASIAVAGQYSPLAGCLVAGHFSALLRWGLPMHESDPGYLARAHAWLAEQEARQARWSEDDRAARGLAHLQLFDRLSLWFCCAEETEPNEFVAPEGIEVQFAPRAPGVVAVRPWPLAVAGLRLSVAGRQVPARRYADADDLAETSGARVSLAWELRPE